MARDLSALLTALDGAVRHDEARSAQARSGAARAEAIAPALVWVHRTGKAADWDLVLKERRLTAERAGTRYEIALELTRAVYFFVGACAYPTGIVALLLSPRVAAAAPSTFTPYDTGALMKHLRPADEAAAWDDDAKTRHLDTHLGHGADVVRFMGPYLSAHFRDPAEYIRRAQKSEPDFPAYHGLLDRDRRAWTVEARVHDDVEIAPDDLLLEEIWLENQDLLDDLPDDFLRIARIAPDGERLEVAVARRIEERVKGGLS